MSTSLPAETISTIGAAVRSSALPCVGMKPLTDTSLADPGVARQGAEDGDGASRGYTSAMRKERP